MRSKKNICRLDVTVHNSLGVRSSQGVRDLYGNLQEVIKFHGFAMDSLLKPLTFQLLHDDEGLAVVVLDVVNSTNARMVKLRGRSRFAGKSLEGAWIFGQVFGNKLQSDMPAQAEIFRFVNNSHSPSAELRQDVIVRNGLPDHLHEFIGRTRRFAAFDSTCNRCNL